MGYNKMGSLGETLGIFSTQYNVRERCNAVGFSGKSSHICNRKQNKQRSTPPKLVKRSLAMGSFGVYRTLPNYHALTHWWFLPWRSVPNPNYPHNHLDADLWGAHRRWTWRFWVQVWSCEFIKMFFLVCCSNQSIETKSVMRSLIIIQNVWKCVIFARLCLLQLLNTLLYENTECWIKNRVVLWRKYVVSESSSEVLRTPWNTPRSRGEHVRFVEIVFKY